MTVFHKTKKSLKITFVLGWMFSLYIIWVLVIDVIALLCQCLAIQASITNLPVWARKAMELRAKRTSFLFSLYLLKLLFLPTYQVIAKLNSLHESTITCAYISE